jgi:nucleoside-diphosphate-sugar epimerase
MTTLITGANGFLGSALVKRLIVAGEPRPICLVRSGSKLDKLEAVRRELGDESFQVRTGSLASVREASQAIEGATTIYHLAAMLGGPPSDMCLNTVVTSRNLLEAVVAQPTPPKVVLVSSFGVYGTAWLPAHSVINEETPLEPTPELRDPYSQIKLRQERLFWDYRAQHNYPLVVLRPGAIYGPESYGLSARIGLQLPGVFLFLGGNNPLPLSYVDNCSDALIAAARSSAADGQVYNVHDDELPTCRQFLDRYVREVRPLRVVPVPYAMLFAGSHAVLRYHVASKGQLPAVFTPYKTRSSWKPMRFDNSKLHTLGWRPLVSSEEAMRRTFESHRRHFQGAHA